MTAPKISVVIPTRNRPKKLLRCVESVAKCSYPSFAITVVDDCSAYDVEAQARASFPNVNVIRNDTRRLLSYSRNLGAMKSDGEYIFFLDDDNVVASDVLTELATFMQTHNSIAVSSPVIYLLEHPDKTWTTYTIKGSFPAYHRLRHDVPRVPTRTWGFHDAFMVTRSVFEQLGGFDSVGFPIHFSEIDFAYRIREEGYDAAVVPSAKVWLDHGETHMHVDSVRAFYTLRNRIVLLKKHEPRFKLAAYLVFMPILLTYYLHHHARNSSDGAYRASLNLLLGVKAGLEYRKAS